MWIIPIYYVFLTSTTELPGKHNSKYDGDPSKQKGTLYTCAEKQEKQEKKKQLFAQIPRYYYALTKFHHKTGTVRKAASLFDRHELSRETARARARRQHAHASELSIFRKGDRGGRGHRRRRNVRLLPPAWWVNIHASLTWFPGKIDRRLLSPCQIRLEKCPSTTVLPGCKQQLISVASRRELHQNTQRAWPPDCASRADRSGAGLNGRKSGQWRRRRARVRWSRD